MKSVLGHSGYGCRHTLAIMSFLGFMNLYAMRVNLSVAIVAMVTHNTTNVIGSNVSSECSANDASANGTDGNQNVSYITDTVVSYTFVSRILHCKEHFL